MVFNYVTKEASGEGKKSSLATFQNKEERGGKKGCRGEKEPKIR